MNRSELMKLVIEKVIEIQQLSGREVPDNVDEKTVPIGGLAGFDSLNGMELALMISDHMKWPADENLCVSDDGTEPLGIGQIVDRLLKVDNPSV